jgi:hypothetical protein
MNVEWIDQLRRGKAAAAGSASVFALAVGRKKEKKKRTQMGAKSKGRKTEKNWPLRVKNVSKLKPLRAV